MYRGTLAPLLVVSSLLASPAAAQTTTDTRTADVSSARQEKAAARTAPTGDKLERLLDFVEHNALLQQFSNPRDGFGVRFGGIESGSGLAAGPMWRSSMPLHGRLQLRASAAASLVRDHEVEGGMAIPEMGTHRMALSAGASATHLAQERFFGAGLGSSRADET